MRYVTLLALLAGCSIPTDYTVHTPECVLPPPSVEEVARVPLGCPWRLADGTIVGGAN